MIRCHVSFVDRSIIAGSMLLAAVITVSIYFTIMVAEYLAAVIVKACP